MAIYHLEAKVVSRGVGRSACAAAAYMSCSAIYNDYDGVQHDYTRKQGLVWQEVFLPEQAPKEWQDRAVLWNAVEETEKTKDSRLAREFVVALPIELGKDEWQSLVSDFIQEQFISDGMCAACAIHDTDGHNPHAHILLTVRPLDEHGKWQYKTEKEYLCVRDGEERGFTASEFKAAQTEGWEKQYPYYVDKKKKEYLPPSEAEARSLERADKHPKSTKFGRQNPITERWNSDEQLVLWRSAWADTVNRVLERSGIEERIDHRSHAERGLDEQPTVHEGVEARAMERKGFVSDRCELNRQIKADNALLRELKTAVRKLMQAVRNTVPAMARALEELRANMIIFQYSINRARTGKRKFSDWLKSAKEIYADYTETVKQLKERTKEKKELSAEKKATPVLKILRHRELTQRIATLTEEIEELRSEKARLLDSLSCKDDSEIGHFKKEVVDTEQAVKRLSVQEEKFTAELEKAFVEYTELKTQTESLDPVELFYARETIRNECEEAAESRIRTASKGNDFWGMTSARQTVDGKLDLYTEEQRVKKILWERTQNEREQSQQKKLEHREHEI